MAVPGVRVVSSGSTSVSATSSAPQTTFESLKQKAGEAFGAAKDKAQDKGAELADKAQDKGKAALETAKAEAQKIEDKVRRV